MNVELHAAGGGQIDADSHGMVVVGVRSGAWRADLLTDTLELAWEPHGDHGRAWVAARANPFSAELFISPWTAGAPDRDRALQVASVGPEAGVLRYGPAGLYGGVAGSVRGYLFSPWSADPDAPPDRLVARAELVGGLWRAWIHGEVHAGLVAEGPERGADAPGAPAGAPLQPRVAAEVHVVPDLHFAPVLDLQGGAAEGEGAVTRTRLGGLVPYVVPVAGAAWAEWWVEDYAAARVGVSGGSTGMGERRDTPRGRLAVWSDLAVFGEAWGDPGAPGHAVGFGAGASGVWRAASAGVDVGWAPWIPRQDGVTAVSVFFRLGLDWSPVRPKAPNGG